MNSSLLALLDFVLFLFGVSFLGQAIAQAQWRGRGSAAVMILLVVCGQLWLIPQAVSVFAFHSNELLYVLWFSNWIALATSVALYGLSLRGRSGAVFDAARLDGAGFFSMYRHVGWPVLKPVLPLVAVLLLMVLWLEPVRQHWPLLPAWTVPRDSQAQGVILAVSLGAVLPVMALYAFARNGVPHRRSPEVGLV
ncbi:MAG: hypothetical protein ACR2NX_12090 [Chthoniobacterales bacterium]